jgi:hypothetical protein
VVVGLGALHAAGKLLKISIPRLMLRGRLTGRRSLRASKEELEERSPLLQKYEELLVPAARELSEESSIVQDYFNLLLPAALEVSAKKEVGHIKLAVKPHGRKSQGRKTF